MCTTSLLPRLIPSLLLSLFLSACGGGDPTEGDAGAQGATGKNALMSVSVEPSGGGHCAVSGSKIDAGLDINANGLLDASEVSSTQYLCSGTAGGGGANALVQMLDEPSGTNCAAGGKAINVGLDGNANGVLEAGEVSSSGYVCSGSAGANGVNGANGSNGANGLSTLFSIASEPVGANCAYGGIKISSAATTNYSCNGAPSADLNWVIVDDANSPMQALRNTNYLATGSAQVTVTLPGNADMTVGDVLRVNGAGAGGWKIVQNAGQAVYAKNLGDMAGRNWTGHGLSTRWVSVASSADGSKLVALESVNLLPDGSRVPGKIYTSSDSGASWVQSGGPNVPSAEWESVASSADGSKLVAVASSGQVYTSSTSGASWDLSSGPNAAPSITWNSAASSADGNDLVIGGAATIYTSRDAGTNWKASTGPNAAPNGNWLSIASSVDGSKLVAARYGSTIYTSADHGANWSPSSGPQQAPMALWRSVASSADGSKLVAVATSGVYVSSDSGANWVLSNAAPIGGLSVACSVDGSKLVIGGSSPNTIYTSNDSGANWAVSSGPNAPPSASWHSVASSADGSKLVAVGTATQIYTSTATTTRGTTGSISGASADAIELQYVGNGMFTVLSHSGSLTIQ